jgi:hypothetical protein
MDLNQYKPRYMTEGEYFVVIIDFEEIESMNGNTGWSFTFKNKREESIRDTYWITEKAMPRLWNLANSAGLSEKQMADFQPEDLIGKMIKIEVEPDGTYFNVKNVMSAESIDEVEKKALQSLADVPF